MNAPIWRRVLGAAALHAAAGAIVVGLAAMLVVVVYVALRVWAVVTGSRAESFPLADMMFETTVTTFVVVIVVLFPVTVFAALLCERVLKWRRAAQVPVSAALLFAPVFGLVDVANQALQGGEPVPWRIVVATWAVLLPALTIYWWVLQVPRVLSRIVAYFHIQRTGF